MRKGRIVNSAATSERFPEEESDIYSFFRDVWIQSSQLDHRFIDKERIVTYAFTY
jgi:hypothetical protein